MRSSSAREAAAALLTALAVAAPRAAAQSMTETSLAAVAVASRPAFGGAGLGFAWRDPGRTRLGLTAFAGGEDGGGAAGRVEAVWHFLLDPWDRRGNGVYGGAGLALVLGSDGRVRPAVQFVLGVETAPAARRGTFIEAGAGRGVRVAVGMRWRKRNAPGR